MLITGLPPDAAFHRRGEMWTQTHELLALVADSVEARLATLAVMWADDKSKRKVPPPITVTHHGRPKREKPAKKTVSPSQLAGLLGGR